MKKTGIVLFVLMLSLGICACANVQPAPAAEPAVSAEPAAEQGPAEAAASGAGISFETKDLNDTIVTSADLFSGHKVTMVNVWETTCVACISEMPELNRLASEFESEGAQLIGIVYDATDEALIAEAKEIASDLNLQYVNLLPTDEIRSIFKTQAFPTTYFVNENGELIDKPILGASISRYVEEVNQALAGNQ